MLQLLTHPLVNTVSSGEFALAPRRCTNQQQGDPGLDHWFTPHGGIAAGSRAARVTQARGEPRVQD